MAMVRWPWRRDPATEGDPRELEADAVVTCSFQDGRLYVYEDHVYIVRAGPSKFADKAIPRAEIVDVTTSKAGAIGYLQIEQDGVEPDVGGFLSSPVDENTLHFGRKGRDCAERARDELLFGPTS